MSAALTGGAFTRTAPQLALQRERAHVHTLLDATPAPHRRAADVAALRRCTAVCDADADFTALRVLSQHAALHAGVVASPQLRPVLARLRARLDQAR